MALVASCLLLLDADCLETAHLLVLHLIPHSPGNQQQEHAQRLSSVSNVIRCLL